MMWHLEPHLIKKNADFLNFYPKFSQVLKFYLWFCGQKLWPIENPPKILFCVIFSQKQFWAESDHCIILKSRPFFGGGAIYMWCGFDECFGAVVCKTLHFCKLRCCNWSLWAPKPKCICALRTTQTDLRLDLNEVVFSEHNKKIF